MKKTALLILIVAISSCKSPKEKLSDQIKAQEMELFNDTIRTMNIDKANSVFKDYLDYADKYSDDTVAAGYLFKAGDLSNGLKRPKEAIAIFERLRKNFPDYRKSASALFMEGFIYETEMQDKEMAKEKYKEFIGKYPDHKLAASAKASLDQLNANLTDEQLIKMFESRNDSLK